MHREVPREVVRVGLGKACPCDDARVVDQDVEAPELLDRRIDERLRAGNRGHVARVGDGRSASGDDLGSGAGRWFGVRSNALDRATQVVDDDAGAPVGEQECMGATDAASRARDHRDAALESVLVHPEPFRRLPTSHYTFVLVPRRGSVHCPPSSTRPPTGSA